MHHVGAIMGIGLVSVGTALEPSLIVLYTILVGILGGVWKTSATMTDIKRNFREGERRMAVTERRLNKHAGRLNALDGQTELIDVNE